MRNFGRVVEVDIETDREKIEIRNLKIVFDVQDQVGDEPAQGRIVVYNLNPDHRAAVRFEKLKSLNKFGGELILRAGYIDQIKELYRGTIISAVNTKNGPDWMTEILVVPEIARLLTAIVTRKQPYATGTPKSSIFFDIVNDLNIPISNPEKTKVLEILGNAAIKKPWTIFGSAVDVLNKLSKQWKEMVNVRYYGNKVSGLVAGESVNTVPVKINRGNLVGSVEVIDGGVRFKTQLNGELNLHKLVDVESETVDDLTTSGKYVTQNVNHRGDNRQGDFFTSCSCVFPNSEKGIFRSGLQ